MILTKDNSEYMETLILKLLCKVFWTNNKQKQQQIKSNTVKPYFYRLNSPINTNGNITNIIHYYSKALLILLGYSTYATLRYIQLFYSNLMHIPLDQNF